MTLAHTRLVNLCLTFIGMVTFAGLFAYISLAPGDFDQRTRDFAISKVQDKVDDQLGGIANSDFANKASDFAGRVSDRLKARVDDARNSLDSGMDTFIADVLAAACKLDCERRKQAETAIREFYESSILRNSKALDRLKGLIEGEYDNIMDELRADLKIFSGSTAIAFALAFGLALFRGRAAAHLLPISIVLTLSTLIAIAWYALGQDWIMTVLYSDYWGWGYAGLIAGLVVLMIDIGVNGARITSAVFNAIGNAIGSSFSFLPC